MLAVSDAQKHLNPNARCVLTGNPIRPDILRQDRESARHQLGVDGPPADFVVWRQFGGPQGKRSRS